MGQMVVFATESVVVDEMNPNCRVFVSMTSYMNGYPFVGCSLHC